MKKAKRKLAGTALIRSLGMNSGCKARPAAVYGPPPEPNSQKNTSTAITDTTTDTVTPIPPVDPATEEIEDVYGPPPCVEEDGDDDEEKRPAPTVYGPPLWMGW